MSIPNRIYRIGKAYLNQARERIEALDAELAERELRAEHGGSPDVPARDDTSPDAMMRRAEERIRAVRNESAARSETESTAKVSRTAEPDAADYRVLGVAVGSDWSAVQSAYEKLARRCDPRRFPDGSQEQRDAQRILERVNQAHEALRKRLDPTESRFGKLEF